MQALLSGFYRYVKQSLPLEPPVLGRFQTDAGLNRDVMRRAPAAGQIAKSRIMTAADSWGFNVDTLMLPIYSEAQGDDTARRVARGASAVLGPIANQD